VANKDSVLFRLAGATIEHPDDTVRAALYPVVGEGTAVKVTPAAHRDTLPDKAAGKYGSPGMDVGLDRRSKPGVADAVRV
jgi:hypothetical protein